MYESEPKIRLVKWRRCYLFPRAKRCVHLSITIFFSSSPPVHLHIPTLPSSPLCTSSHPQVHFLCSQVHFPSILPVSKIRFLLVVVRNGFSTTLSSPLNLLVHLELLPSHSQVCFTSPQSTTIPVSPSLPSTSSRPSSTVTCQ